MCIHPIFPQYLALNYVIDFLKLKYFFIYINILRVKLCVFFIISFV